MSWKRRLGPRASAGAALLVFAASSTGVAAVEFNRDIRPILSDKCFTCHGPDAASKGIKLRLDSEAAARADLGGRHAIVPGDPANSELIRRVASGDNARRMPPAFTGVKLTEREKTLLSQWVEQGAAWQGHWAYVPPRRPPQPEVQNAGWARNPIDFFVLARLEREGLAPSPEAARETWIRRVSLDLTGLAPAMAEADAFLADSSPRAYEKEVDRLLASPRYAERMAARWLDAARYADTNGYQTDGERNMWRWRDWVIDAFHTNKPFDRFTIEQLAGDLLPNPTLDQRIATGFNRNHRGNGEGGIVPEEYKVEYVADRVETTATVWLGTTLGCARCHNHKYDPFTQKEFYQLFAYFHNIPERGRYFKFGNTPPLVAAPTQEQAAKLKVLDERLAAAENRFHALRGAIAQGQRDWERSLGGGAARLPWFPAEALAHHTGDAGEFDGQRVVEAGDVAPFGYFDRFTLAARIHPVLGKGQAAPQGAIVVRGKDEEEKEGYGLALSDGKLRVSLVQRWLDDALHVETKRKLQPNRWYHVAMTYDGSRVAGGIQIYVDGQAEEVKILLDELNQEFRTKEPLRIGGGYGRANRFQGKIEEVRAYSRALPAGEIALLAGSAPVEEKLRRAYLEQFGPAETKEAWKELLRARREREQFADSLPTVMVMEENPAPSDAFLLVRGAYDRPGERVAPGVPAALPPIPGDRVNNRLAFAEWLVSPSHPLTARVVVNRIWQAYFGTGLVKTVEDFGSQGEWPSHPDLLDWLAVEFRESGWNLKHLHKLIVMSATYRQSSRVTAELLQRDPENRLLARGPRLRLPAETIRDQALAVSGLLVDRVGGPSVKPYQPAGLWKELSGGQDYQRDSGDNLYRRSLYTFWKRTSPPPSMANFDASSRETCIVRETRTNTPLQALNLMNDVTFLEASRKLAERMMREGGASPAQRIAHGFRLATSRHPKERETALLADSWRHHVDIYRTDPAAAGKLLSHGESPRDESLPAPELAAYAVIANLIFNLDEVVTKE